MSVITEVDCWGRKESMPRNTVKLTAYHTSLPEAKPVERGGEIRGIRANSSTHRLASGQRAGVRIPVEDSEYFTYNPMVVTC